MSGSLKSVSQAGLSPPRLPPLNRSQALQKQYRAAIARWPKDDLRPDVQLPDVLTKHLADRLAGRSLARPILRPSGSGSSPVDTAPAAAAPLADSSAAPTSDLQQLRQINALFSLLDDRYKKAVSWCGRSLEEEL